MKKFLLFSALFLMFLLVASGCSKTYVTGFHTESNFAYPNSNVTPVGYAAGASSPACSLFGQKFVTSDMQDEAVKNALQAKQADILVNYIAFTKLSNFLIVNCTEYMVEGTAAKMVIGTQKLK